MPVTQEPGFQRFHHILDHSSLLPGLFQHRVPRALIEKLECLILSQDPSMVTFDRKENLYYVVVDESSTSLFAKKNIRSTLTTN